MARITKRRPMPGDVVRVEWLDARTLADWYPTRDATVNLPRVISYGVLLVHSRIGVSLAQGVTEDAANYLGCLDIPCGMVQSITVLRRGAHTLPRPRGAR